MSEVIRNARPHWSMSEMQAEAEVTSEKLIELIKLITCESESVLNKEDYAEFPNDKLRETARYFNYFQLVMDSIEAIKQVRDFEL